MPNPSIFLYFITRGIKLSKVHFMIQLPFGSTDKCCRSKDNSCCTWTAELTPNDWLQPADRSVQRQSPVLHCDLYMPIDKKLLEQELKVITMIIDRRFFFSNEPGGKWSFAGAWDNMRHKFNFMASFICWQLSSSKVAKVTSCKLKRKTLS